MRIARVFYKGQLAGELRELAEKTYEFKYDEPYLNKGKSPVSLTLPLQRAPYLFEDFPPFFDGLIPEGWLLHLAQKNWKLDSKDRMGLLLKTCQDCIGAVHIEEVQDA